MAYSLSPQLDLRLALSQFRQSMVLTTAVTVTATVGITKTILAVKKLGKMKKRKEVIVLLPKEKDLKQRKTAKEAAERANKTKDPIVVHPAWGKIKQPHYHPNKNSHDHFYFPKRFWIMNMFVKYKKIQG